MRKHARFHLRGLLRFTAKLRGDSPEMQAVFRQWGSRYLAFVRRRFAANSRGGGDWKPLARSTVKARRGGRKGRKRRVAILRDTGTLFNALTVGMPGNLYRLIRHGIRVGFSGATRHPKGKATIRDIAHFHDTGAGRLPKREILVPPDDPTKEAMKQDLRRAVNRVGKASESANR